MPMNFPDLESLQRAAEVWKFRQPKEDETEEQFRATLADYVQPRDYIESFEIRNKVGWDKFSEEQNKDMIRRKGLRV